jgi:hypothetical protein
VAASSASAAVRLAAAPAPPDSRADRNSATGRLFGDGMSSRASTAVALVAALAAIAVCTAPAGGAPASTVPDSGVELVECKRGKRAVDRNALFRGEMRQIPNGTAMRMLFQLTERVGNGAWRADKAPGLETWRNARPGVGRFAYRQRIASLQPGTAYRVLVTFQWHDAAGMLIGRQSARSPACRQGGKLPNVRVAALDRSPGPTPDTSRYTVSVLNSGSVVAKRVAVSLSIDGAQVDTRAMGNIGAHRRREIAFIGPACSALVTVAVDPNDALRESDERDNRRSFPCSYLP